VDAVVVVGRVVVVVVVVLVVVVEPVVVVDALVVVVDPVVLVELEVVVDDGFAAGGRATSLEGTHRRSHGAKFQKTPCRRVVCATLMWKHNSSERPFAAVPAPAGTHRRDGLTSCTDIWLLIVSDVGDWNCVAGGHG